jgi:hypothetical protein
MAIDYGKILEDLKDSVTATVKEVSKDFLDQHQDAKDFLEEQAKDMASLGVEYLKAKDDAERSKLEFQMKLVVQSVRNKLASIALDAEASAKETFGKVLQAALNVALNVAIKLLPVVLAAV